jgi:group I intron endonuclease
MYSSNMYVYTICSIQKYNGERLIYVGSTNDYEKRFIDHKSNCYNPKRSHYNAKVYQLIRQHGWDAFVMEVIEVLDDNTTDKDLRFREQHYIDKYNSKSSMNSQDAFVSDADRVEYNRLNSMEWYKNNRKKRTAQSKKHYENNRDKRNTQSKEWRENNRGRENELQRLRRHKKSSWKSVITDLRGIDPSYFC